MPIFEFECETCHAEFEELLRQASQRPDVSCPSCGGQKVRRKLSVFSAPATTAPSGNSASPTCGTCGGAPGSCMAG